MRKGTIMMKQKKMHANYHIDLDQEVFLELRINADKVNAEDPDSLVCELWIVNTGTDEKLMREYDFVLSSEEISITDLFDHNLYRIMSRYRKKGLPELSLWPHKEYRWLYYKREFEAVLPVLRQWGHAKLDYEFEELSQSGKEIAERR